jgi:Tfp pilus assembly protein PilO
LPYFNVVEEPMAKKPAETKPIESYESIDDTARSIGSRSRVYQLLNKGHLRGKKDGKKTHIEIESRREYLDSLPPYQPGREPKALADARRARKSEGGLRSARQAASGPPNTQPRPQTRRW